ncbi:MAG: hypothetical protein KZQ67_16270 [gamma proteobacterium symbiont of Bathyaustriella thionipta]|nr:hypothetical protein [gamma proteobacterium symbiont of Bathyaustriella thionipta]MCU7951544.1 hypothetical protein [gamma proteobacterium symbiont of Bathyaustriella thionipta]MCU7958138.1 hypothetical protein [gamma proteobacterium symbiont of Bathyaustriella thionipta]
MKSNVNKKLDYLITDPHSQSGKAKNAKNNGFTQIIAENAFWSMLGEQVD